MSEFVLSPQLAEQVINFMLLKQMKQLQGWLPIQSRGNSSQSKKMNTTPGNETSEFTEPCFHVSNMVWWLDAKQSYHSSQMNTHL